MVYEYDPTGRGYITGNQWAASVARRWADDRTGDGRPRAHRAQRVFGFVDRRGRERDGGQHGPCRLGTGRLRPVHGHHGPASNV
ncbi:unnamed protein product [Macrosiphum euphorbiae]|uniref:Uncharacterized protein n=1 Tax=Macrosiphum euphorbiae TaxID=13131 RepID=A0AAV0YB00_9HEMI|nr:unnamed protein product [Macrosiphum euphorbiae]